MPSSEPRNPFYALLLIAGVLFTVTAVAYAIVPTLEQKAAEAGQPPPPSPWRERLAQDGWRWLLYELAAVVVLSLLCMGLDRWRLAKQQHDDERTPPDSSLPAAGEEGQRETMNPRE